MAKAQGIIGNFKGKIGNTVGYQLTSSNNKQTQGIRIYQPNVKNPKTSAQAEQRAKLAPINATYRALKMIIDRGNEGLPYGNKSRLAWLKQAFKAQVMPWFVKGAVANYPVACMLTKGSLAGVKFNVAGNQLVIVCSAITDSKPLNNIGAVSKALLDSYPTLKAGDQLTFVSMGVTDGVLLTDVFSLVIDLTSTEGISFFNGGNGELRFSSRIVNGMGCVIVSREGDNGEHLRSSTSLVLSPTYIDKAPYDADSKTAAIESYMASGAANTDWAEESIQ